MAEILSADEIDALLSTVGCYDDIYIHKKVIKNITLYKK